MPALWLFLLLRSAVAAPPSGDGVAPHAEAPSTTDTQGETLVVLDERPDAFRAVLERSKLLYFAGQADEAYDMLRGLQVRLLLGEVVDRTLAAEALVWLGEIQYKSGRTTEAREAFRWLLERDPDHPISPYAHPMEVVGEFELVRREVQQGMEMTSSPSVTAAPIPAAPGWIWAPFGAPQIAQRRIGTGIAIASVQLGLGAASLGMAARLRTLNSESHPAGWEDDEVAKRVQQLRYGVQFPLTVAFYGAWLGSAMEARGAWRRSHASDLLIRETARGKAPPPGGTSGFVISGAF